MFKRILRDSFYLVFGNLETVFRACGAWFVLQFVLIIATQLLVGETQETTETTPAAALIAIISFVFALASSASISVAWHRFGLLGEQPDLIHLKLGAIEGQFILKMILLALILMVCMVPVVLVFALLSSMLQAPAVMIVLWLVAAVFLVPHFMRLYLTLPAVAVERPLGFKEAYELGKGLGWSMFGAAFTLSLPFIVVSVGLQLLLGFVGGGLPLILIQFKVLILNLLLQIIVTVLGISVITAGYRIAMERAHGAGAGPSRSD
ncbi:hypothetical protein [Roseibium polysiphoniae]|uniref:Glycerophosphoryl diester phosphodiesterase membrane domain-containing protein n=1 Tax=Roseibium polysiphoniae TaxID=2571221 RepID=A0A944CHN0_9HYPH|nr:hypothetical protein [Roseibium polysiphoniae]MBS8261978.1 hypothetical protein [Roseibium polysiphoniae]